MEARKLTTIQYYWMHRKWFLVIRPMNLIVENYKHIKRELAK